jgi:hypothetical protein
MQQLVIRYQSVIDKMPVNSVLKFEPYIAMRAIIKTTTQRREIYSHVS